MEHLSKLSYQKFLVFVVFSFFVLWWILVQLGVTSDYYSELFTDSYGVLALLGGFFGIGVSRKWGFLKSHLGKAIFFASLGLLAQFFGQISYTYYALVLGREIPYPSIGDIGYFGSIPLYIFSTINLAKASGVRFTLKNLESKIQAILIPVFMVFFGYTIFLWGYSFDFTNTLGVLLDFGYPLGEAVYVSLAILTLLLSRKVLGGLMRPVIFFVLLALVFQFIADYLFLYRFSRGIWTPAGISDFAYLIAYFLMTLSFMRLGELFEEVSIGKNLK